MWKVIDVNDVEFQPSLKRWKPQKRRQLSERDLESLNFEQQITQYAGTVLQFHMIMQWHRGIWLGNTDTVNT